LHRLHVHVHVEVNLLVLTGTEGGSFRGSRIGDDLIDGSVVVGVLDGEFSVQDLVSAETLDVLRLFRRDDADRQKGDEKVSETHIRLSVFVFSS